MPLTPSRVIRRHIEPEGAYHRDEPDTGGKEPVRLNWNESPFGLSPKAQAAFDAFRTGNTYPEIDQAPLRAAFGRYLDVDPDRIIVGAGLDDVINTLAMTIAAGYRGDHQRADLWRLSRSLRASRRNRDRCSARTRPEVRLPSTRSSTQPATALGSC